MRTFVASLVITTALIAAPGAISQTPNQDWDTRFETVLQIEGATEDKATRLKALVVKAKTVQNELAANYFYALTALELGRPGEAAYHLEAALKLHDDNNALDIETRDLIVTWLIKAYQQVGRESDMLALIDENVSRKDGLLSDLWVASEDGITHRMTGLYCPNSLDGIFRDKAMNFSAVGIDMGCNYKAITEHRNDITVYLTKTNQSPTDAHDSAVEAVIGNWGERAIVYRSKPAPFTGPRGLPVLDTLFRGQSGLSTQAFTANIDGWTLKARITWGPELGENFGMRQGQKLFSSLADNVQDRLANCKTVNPSGSQTVDGGPGAMAVLLVMSADKSLRQVPARPAQECIAAAANTGQWFVARHSGKASRLYTVAGEGVSSEVFVVNTAKSGAGLVEAKYALIDVDAADDGFTLIALYENLPSADDVLTNYNAFRNGTGHIIGSVSMNDKGETTVNINPEAMK